MIPRTQNTPAGHILPEYPLASPSRRCFLCRSSLPLRQRPSIDSRRFPRDQSGTSLVELLAVSALIVAMAAVLYSSIDGLASTAARRGAVNILMNAFEHARIAALESGQTVHVGFADKEFPIEGMQYKAFLVFRDTSEEERVAGFKDYVVLRKWTKLPGNVAFKRMANSVVSEAGGQTFAGLNEVLPDSQSDETFPCISFNSSGAVSGAQYPIELFLYEGYFSEDNDIPTRISGKLFETISFSRYTGRVEFNVTAPDLR
jgi:Tfp pilus assembly protein FimT